VKDDHHIFARTGAVFGAQQIAFDQVNSGPVTPVRIESFDPRRSTGGSDETAQVAEATMQQRLYDSGSNEPARPRHQDRIIRSDYEILAIHRFHIAPLIGYVRLPDRVDAQECEESAEMLKKLHQTRHKSVVPPGQRERQGSDVCWYGDE